MPEETYPVVEIFDSLQGEGLYVGTPCTFVRLWGCLNRCAWCDTKYAWERPRRESATEKTVSEIVERVSRPHVVLTGGEPFSHSLSPLIAAIPDSTTIEIETSGRAPHVLSLEHQGRVCITVSPKPINRWRFHPSFRRCLGALKYVVTPEFTVDQAIPEEYLHGEIPVYLQPLWVGGGMSNLEAVLTLLMEYPQLRLSVQLHKLLELR